MVSARRTNTYKGVKSMIFLILVAYGKNFHPNHRSIGRWDTRR